jgi:hypothetical protein
MITAISGEAKKASAITRRTTPATIPKLIPVNVPYIYGRFPDGNRPKLSASSAVADCRR